METMAGIRFHADIWITRCTACTLQI